MPLPLRLMASQKAWHSSSSSSGEHSGGACTNESAAVATAVATAVVAVEGRARVTAALCSSEVASPTDFWLLDFWLLHEESEAAFMECRRRK